MELPPWVIAFVGGGGIVGGFLPLVRFLWDLRKGRAQAEAARDDRELRERDQTMVHMEKALARLDTDLTRALQGRETDRKRMDALEADNEQIAEENRGFRKVILGVVSRLEIIAAWVRDGHHPPPPYTTEQILAYVREGTPHLWKDDQ